MRRLLILGLAFAVVASSVTEGRSSSPAASGRIVFSDRVWPPGAGDNWEVFVVDVAGGRPRNLTRDSRCDDGWPAWSRDGTRIAFVCGGRGVYVMSANGSSRRRLITTSETVDGLSWSSDGRQIAFVRRGWIWMVGVADRSTKRLVRTSGYVTSWSRNGSRIAFERSGRDGGIWSTRIDGGGERRLTRNSADGHPSWSPDGSRIAFSRRGTVWIMRPDGSGQRKTAVSASDPIWAPDSRHFAFSSSAPASLGGGVWIVGLDGRNSRRVASAEQIAGFSWGPGPVAR